MAIDNVSLTTAVNQQQNTAGSTTKLAEDFSQFLTLLTIQLQNQDPLSPMDTTEFTNQLVGFAGVEQQINSNQKLDALVAMQLGNGLSSALSYVGTDISYVSSEFNYSGTGNAEINYSLADPSVSTKVRVYDESGAIVYETEGAHTAGQSKFVWDGKDKYGQQVDPGTYEVKIDALDANDEAIDDSIVVSGRVKGVETQNGTIFLLVGDRAVPVNTVLNAKVPATTPTDDDSDA